MGVSFTILNGESWGPRFLLFDLDLLGFFLVSSSKMSSSASISSSGRRYWMRMMHQMPPVSILL